MTSAKYVGMDVHMESILICVRNSVGKVVMESVIETKASIILQFIDRLRGDLRVQYFPDCSPTLATLISFAASARVLVDTSSPA